jgi:hypothetical protein
MDWLVEALTQMNIIRIQHQFDNHIIFLSLLSQPNFVGEREK